jgi:hypothetical protein
VWSLSETRDKELLTGGVGREGKGVLESVVRV